MNVTRMFQRIQIGCRLWYKMHFGSQFNTREVLLRLYRAKILVVYYINTQIYKKDE